MVILFVMLIGWILPNTHSKKDFIEGLRIAAAELVVELVIFGPIIYHFL